MCCLVACFSIDAVRFKGWVRAAQGAEEELVEKVRLELVVVLDDLVCGCGD